KPHADRRIRLSADYFTASVFGDRATSDAAAARVRLIHRSIRGIDPVTGRAYSADDPDTQLWVHCVEWHSFLAVYRAYVGGLSPEDEDRYIADGVRVAPLIGLPAEIVPRTVAEQRAYFAAVRPQLCVSGQERGTIGVVLNPPPPQALL